MRAQNRLGGLLPVHWEVNELAVELCFFSFAFVHTEACARPEARFRSLGTQLEDPRHVPGPLRDILTYTVLYRILFVIPDYPR